MRQTIYKRLLSLIYFSLVHSPSKKNSHIILDWLLIIFDELDEAAVDKLVVFEAAVDKAIADDLSILFWHL